MARDQLAPRHVPPTKVARHALQNAASVAGLILTTDAMVAELPKKEEAIGRSQSSTDSNTILVPNLVTIVVSFAAT